MSPNPILHAARLGFPWVTQDPFLFCAYHQDDYPAGNEAMGLDPEALQGRNLGQDFDLQDGFRMYHGQVVPGFLQHPHRGFETITVMRQGMVDHSDSLGATARFGAGDVQWMTAGKGIVHCEMFPLLKADQRNPAELFQIWLNLPKANKMVEPHFSMLWKETVPKVSFADSAGKTTHVTVVAGNLNQTAGPKPPPASWAGNPDAQVAVWTIDMAPGAQWTLPKGPLSANRTLYFYRGSSLSVAGKSLSEHAALFLVSDVDISLEAGPDGAQLLLLQGKPIDEPVVQYGPFVMSSEPEIRQAFADYRQTQFGGWPWKQDDPVHPRSQGRFAKHPGGRIDLPPAG